MNNTNPVHRIAEASAIEVLRDSVDIVDQSGNIYAMSPGAFDADMMKRNVGILRIATKDAIWAEEIRTKYEEYTKSHPAEIYYELIPKTDISSDKELSPDTVATLASDVAWENIGNGKFPDGSVISGQVLRFINEPLPPTEIVVAEMKEIIDSIEESSVAENLTEYESEDEFRDELRKMNEEESTYYRDKFGSVFATDDEKQQNVGPEIVPLTPETLTPEVLAETSELFRALVERDIEIASEKAMTDFAVLLKKIREKRTR